VLKGGHCGVPAMTAPLPARSAVVDGEMILPTVSGASDFE
jgi:hypothetical protein